MSLSRIVAAALLVSAAAGGASAATGSGQVNFAFTGFSGPFAFSTLDNLGDPSAWTLTGAVNGVVPTVNGVTSPAPAPDSVYVGGTTPLSGASVTMVYEDLPGAIASVITFTPAAFTGVSTGQAFLLGTLSYVNGQWVGGSGVPATNYPVRLSFTLSTTSQTQAFNQSINDSLVVVTNQSQAGTCGTLADQKDEADFLYLGSKPDLGSMRVYDSGCGPPGATNAGSVQLWGRFGSLEFVDFRNPEGSAFLVDSIDVGTIGGAIPEPGAWALMIAGFGLAGASLRRRRAWLRAA